MSHALNPPFAFKSFRKERPKDFEKYRAAVFGVTDLIPATIRGPVLLDLLALAVKEEIRHAISEPAWIRGALEIQGQAVLAGLIKDNWRRIGTTSDVIEKFGFSNSNLHRLKDDGKVICYRPEGEQEFLFPLDQFDHRIVQAWAADVVAALGNGSGAFHFIFVPRTDLSNRSFMDLYRESPSDGEAAMREALKYLTAE